MIIGEKFKGIIRTLKVLNWPKLEMHYKGVFLEKEKCKKFEGQPQCELCSTEYRGGHCFPNCELDEAPSILSDQCQKC